MIKRLIKTSSEDINNELMLTLMDITNRLDDKDFDDAINECSNLGYNSEMKRLFLVKDKLKALKDNVNDILYDIRNKMNRKQFASLSFDAVKKLMLQYDDDKYTEFLSEYEIDLFDTVEEAAAFVVDNDGKHYYNVDMVINGLRQIDSRYNPCVMIEFDIENVKDFKTKDEAKIFALELLMNKNQEGYLKLVNILKNQ